MSEPAPPFRFSRESRIRIDRDGHFWHEDERVAHERLARALAGWLDVDEASGRYVLRNALDWCYVTVEDAPLVVTSAAAAPDGFRLSLTDGTTEPLDPRTLRLDEDDVPYCSVRGGRLPARFSRQAAYALLEHARPAGDSIALDAPAGPVVVPRVARGAGARCVPRR